MSTWHCLSLIFFWQSPVFKQPKETLGTHGFPAEMTILVNETMCAIYVHKSPISTYRCVIHISVMSSHSLIWGQQFTIIIDSLVEVTTRLVYCNRQSLPLNLKGAEFMWRKCQMKTHGSAWNWIQHSRRVGFNSLRLILLLLFRNYFI